MGLLRRTAPAVRLAMTVSLIKSGGRFAGIRSNAVSLRAKRSNPIIQAGTLDMNIQME